MVNRVRRSRVGVPIGNADSIGLAVTVADQLVANYGPSVNAVEKAISQTPVTAPTRTLTGSASLTAADSGKVIVFDGAASVIASLPRASSCKGCRYRFVWKQLPTGIGHAVSPDALDAVGGGITALTTVVNKDVVSVIATDALTDRLEIVSTGVTGTGAWQIVETVGVFSKEA